MAGIRDSAMCARYQALQFIYSSHGVYRWRVIPMLTKYGVVGLVRTVRRGNKDTTGVWGERRHVTNTHAGLGASGALGTLPHGIHTTSV